LLKLHFVSRNAGEGIEGLWIGLCKAEAEIVVQELKTPPPLLVQIAMSKKNAGVASPQPTYVFESTPSTSIARTGGVKIATVTLLVQHSPPDPAYPYICRFYWDDISGHWLPLDMCYLWVNTAGLKRVSDF
jgi:hypothetical protein